LFLPTNFYEEPKNDSVSEIKLSDLFEKNSDYLKILYDLCVSEFENKWGETFGLEEGPNVRWWHNSIERNLDDTFIITYRGLKFFFQESRTIDSVFLVTIPYKDMKKIIPPDIPLPYRD
jgi:hypothetical protein